MLFHDPLADHCSNKGGNDHARDQRHGHPGLQHIRRSKDGVLTAIGDHLIRHKSEQACREAALAKRLGYDAVLLSPGGLADLSEQDLVVRTHDVAQNMPVIGFYLQTACGGRRLPFDYWRAVTDTPNVVAIKCASFNRYQTIDLVRGVAFSKRRGEVALYTGNDDNIVIDLLTPYRFIVDGETVELRFVGGLLGHWSVWTHNVVQMYSSC